MEQQAAQYWMWMKRKHVMKARIQASMMMKPYDSWEEQAFAEDAAGPLGGCIWPPRSYSCSFCRREFRSAQALGGHMNVHRRDRARLKQSLSPQNEVDDHHQILRHDDHHDHKININNPYKSSCTQCPSSDQLCSNHYSNCSPSLIIASSSLSTSRVSASSTLENFSGQTLLSSYSKSSPYLCTPFGSKSEKYAENEELLGMGGRHGDCVDTDLSVGLNLVVQRNQPTDGSDGDDHQVMISCKRHKTFANTPFIPFFLKPCLMNPSSTMEELDLELRLGDPPKVK